ncbi:DUF6801 domain-containing protein [Spirillospora sp. CA-294931]|uniref:DUF6801 domain-containing protein n=1 Tax=Spirillospora sp. CA-294931 TaxID=3240042 RepID=UPI003D907AAA
MRFQGAFPSTGSAGGSIQPKAVAMTALIPESARADITQTGAGLVAGRATLSALATQNKTPAGAEWDLKAAEQKVIKGAELALRMAGEVPPVVTRPGGDLSISLGTLAMSLEPRKPDGSAPTSLTVMCTPNLGQDTTVVTVPLSGQKAQPNPVTPVPGAAPEKPRTKADLCPPAPEGGFNQKLIKKYPNSFEEPPEGSVVREEAEVACARLTGRTNVNKLKGSSTVKGEAVAMAGAWVAGHNDKNYLQTRSYGKSMLEPSEATFLTFGFMPTTAKLEVTQVGNMNIAQYGPSGEDAFNPDDMPTRSTAYAEVSLRIYDVNVNGTPLDVGPNCRSARPMDLVLTGNSQIELPYELKGGGWLTGKVEIPPFKGCGVGENLDRLFTSSISGSGNYLSLTQGILCYERTGDSNLSPCPPKEFGYIVTGRENWSSTPEGFRVRVATTPRFVFVDCAAGTASGTFRVGSGLPARRIASLREWKATCKISTPGEFAGYTFDFTAVGPWWMDINSYIRYPSGPFEIDSVDAFFKNVSFRFEATSPAPCSFDFGATTTIGKKTTVVYRNRDQAFVMGRAGGLKATNVSGCPRGGAGIKDVMGQFFSSPVFPGIGNRVVTLNPLPAKP